MEPQRVEATTATRFALSRVCILIGITLGIEVSRDYDDKEKREERREKREETREKREERREKRSQKRPPEIPKFIDSRVCWPLCRLESLHFYRVGGLEAS